MNGTAISNNKPSVLFETKRVLVTPKLAAETLEHNSNNRNLTPARVDEFTYLMKNGLFQCTHQGIALDNNGEIIDGQHRLAAVVKSGCSVYMLVSKGLPESSRLAVDTGKARSALAISKIMGLSHTNKSFAIARVLKYGPVKATQMHIPTEQLFGFVDMFSEGIDFVLNECNYTSNTPAVILAVIARASYTKEHKKLQRFMEVYGSGTPSGESENSAIKLKMCAIAARGGTSSVGTVGVRNNKSYLYNCAESAVSDFITGYPTKVVHPTKIEKFPLPQEFDAWNG